MDSLPQYGSHAFIPYLSPRLPPTKDSIELSVLQPDSERLTLHNTSSWTYCGPLLAPDGSQLPHSFHTWSASTVSSPSALLDRLIPFLRFLSSFLQDAGANNYWLTIRATKPTNEYNTVRWHTDDIFFDHDGETDRLDGRSFGPHKAKRNGYWKMATTLLGPPTLFLKHGVAARRVQRQAKRAECEKRGAHTCSQFRCLGCQDAVEAVRQTLAEKFAKQAIESPAYGEVAFFRLGDEEGAMHSEPACHTDRIFINIVPGTKSELAALLGRWGLEYPRAWTFGVPVAFNAEALPLTNEKVHDAQRADSPIVGQSDLVVADKPSDCADASSERCLSTMSTMSITLRTEYADWLAKKGFRFAKLFGHSHGHSTLVPSAAEC